jgi:hypothetical protein
LDGSLTGCVCAEGTWASVGSDSCIPIACDTPGYVGVAGSCACAAGFAGTVSYADGAPTGCVAVPKATTFGGSSDSSKDQAKYVVLFAGCFLVLGALVCGGLYAGGCVGGAGAGVSALPTKAPKGAGTTGHAM